MGPGGFPRNSSCAFAGVTQLWNMPAPPRITQFEDISGDHAKPSRGLHACWKWLNTGDCTFITPSVTWLASVDPCPRKKLPKAVSGLREYGLPKSSQRIPIVKVKRSRAFQASWAKTPCVLDAAFQSHRTGFPVSGS